MSNGNSCPYCQEFEDGFLRVKDENLGRRILLETPNFVVFPTLGCFIEGYLLIASKFHYIGIGQIPSNLHQELEEVQQKVSNVLLENYGIAPVFFEHGPASCGNKGGGCIVHAHLHALPVEVDLLQDISSLFECQPVTGFGAMQQLYAEGTPYLFWQNADGKRFVFKLSRTDFLPSQFIRRIIAEKLGLPERWDWRSYLGLTELQNTIQTLKGFT
ncbi:MAG: hypothetical protein WC768_02655 [Patescibacteria group bacterium]|jgi:diadenosine tetraphosphate (Ap4A) HIT family hydrolase